MQKKIITISLLIISLTPLYSQVLNQGYEVGQLRFDGNKIFNNDQLLNVVQTRETPAALWKWIYRRFDKEILGGQKPEYYDPLIFTSDYFQLKRYYEDNGFFHTLIDTNIVIRPDEEKVYLTFFIYEGRRSNIDTIRYKGFENLPKDVLEELTSNKNINVGAPYINSKVEVECRRIVSIFANNGYMNVKVEKSSAERYASTDNFTILFAFKPGKRYTFGKIAIEQDTTVSQRIDTSVVLRHLDFVTGEYYSEQKKSQSEQNLNHLGVFETTKIESAIPNLTKEDTEIPMRVFVRTRSFQELTPEVGVNDENNAFNVMFGIGYNHRNFFGGARNFSTKLWLTLQSLQFQTLFEGKALHDSSFVSKVELTTQVIQPYFINNKTIISATLSAMLDKQPSYYIPSLSFRIGTQSQTATYTKFFVDWNLQLSSPKTVATQQDTISTTLKEMGFEKQFNSIITLALQRDKRNDIFLPSEGFFNSITFEEGGSFPRIFGKVLGLNLPYAQYVKLNLVGQWYWDPSNKQDVIWATRWRLGTAFLYGNSPIDVPLTQRYFSGGSGSVRGWTARGLGAVPDRTQGGDALFEGTIEARWNLLRDAGSILDLNLEKISVVFFADCGSVWTKPKEMRLTELGIATGFGLRYNTIAGPIRIDFGMKVYDPDAPEDWKWITQKRFFPETFASGVIHLGVGHTF